MIKRIEAGAHDPRIALTSLGITTGLLILIVDLKGASGATLQKWTFVYIVAYLVVSAWAWIVPRTVRDVERQFQMGNEALRTIKRDLLNQEMVDIRLKQLARVFDEECRRQVSLQGVDDAEWELRDATERVTYSKSDFWQAHSVAQQLGYAVKENVKDYLPKEEPEPATAVSS